MKKDSENIILFPGLKQRLYEKGIARLEAQDFQEAADLLRQAKEMDPDDSQIAAAFLVALYEGGDYIESKQIAAQLLHEGIGDYYEILDIYLMILIQLNEHQHVILTLEALFDEKEVPPEKAAHFRTLLQLSKKVVANGDQAPKEQITVNPEWFVGHDLHEQTLQLGSLVDKNIHPYMDSLVSMLGNNASHPFLQTIVLNILRENHIEKTVVVRKFEFEGEFIPEKLPSVHDTPLFKDVMRELENQLEDDNPVLLSQIKEMGDRHAFILYPFEYTVPNPKLWAAAYRGIGYEMYGEEWNKEKVAALNGIEVTDLDQALSFLLYLEQISSPIV